MKLVRFDAASVVEPDEGWKRVGLCKAAEISIEHFTKPPGHASPMHHHENLQVLVLLQGTLIVRNDAGEEHTMQQGDCLYIPGHEPHSAINPADEPAAGLDIFVPGRSLDFWSD